MVLASGNGREEERRRGERRGEKVNKLWQTHVMKAERDWQALHIRWGAQGYCKHSHVNLPGVGRERDTAHTLFSGAGYFKNEWQRCTRKRERFPDNQHAANTTLATTYSKPAQGSVYKAQRLYVWQEAT